MKSRILLTLTGLALGLALAGTSQADSLDPDLYQEDDVALLESIPSVPDPKGPAVNFSLFTGIDLDEDVYAEDDVEFLKTIR